MDGKWPLLHYSCPLNFCIYLGNKCVCTQKSCQKLIVFATFLTGLSKLLMDIVNALQQCSWHRVSQALTQHQLRGLRISSLIIQFLSCFWSCFWAVFELLLSSFWSCFWSCFLSCLGAFLELFLKLFWSCFGVVLELLTHPTLKFQSTKRSLFKIFTSRKSDFSLQIEFRNHEKSC